MAESLEPHTTPTQNARHRRSSVATATGFEAQLPLNAHLPISCAKLHYVAAEQPATRLIRANTTQLAQGFFGRHGFVAVQVVTGGYGAGLDHVVMDRLNPR